MGKIQLVLDIGGVLATNLSPMLWRKLSAAGNADTEKLYTEYKQQLSSRLWTGQLTEPQFWQWLSERLPGVAEEEAKRCLRESFRLLPAADQLANWSKRADLHILSNHRSEWTNSLMAPVIGCFATTTISSDVGLRKPDPRIFDHVNRQLPHDAPVLFVDDHPANLEQAALHGWRTLHADEEGRWIKQIAALLDEGGDHVKKAAAD